MSLARKKLDVTSEIWQKEGLAVGTKINVRPPPPTRSFLIA